MLLVGCDFRGPPQNLHLRSINSISSIPNKYEGRIGFHWTASCTKSLKALAPGMRPSYWARVLPWSCRSAPSHRSRALRYVMPSSGLKECLSGSKTLARETSGTSSAIYIHPWRIDRLIKTDEELVHVWAADAGEQRPRPLQDVLAGLPPLKELPELHYTACQR